MEGKETPSASKKAKFEWSFINPDTEWIKAKWLAIDHLQKQIKDQDFKGESLWHNLEIIVRAQPNRLIAITDKKSGQLAGYILVDFFYKGDAPAIHLIEVLPEFRRSGLGTILVKLAQMAYYKHGRFQADEPLFYANCVLDSAKPFFKSLGFAPNAVGEWCVKR